MAARKSTRRHRRSDAQLAFDAVAIEGGLLSPEWLARAAQLDAGGQGEADYRIPKGLNLRDEVGRYWRIARALWTDFEAGCGKAGSDEAHKRALSEKLIVPLLRDCFGFATIQAVKSVEAEGRAFPIGHSALEGRVPVVIGPAGIGLDTFSPLFGDGGRRRSAFGLCQEFLNTVAPALWGIVTDGTTLRVLRDNASLTRPTWLEADLARIFTEERYADFTALWLLIHETRFGRPDQPVTECSLEAWREAGREEGTRAREQLRHGVEEALVALGQGFLAHPENQSLRSSLASGDLTKEAYFQELLRLAYRMIFLLTVEERGVLHADDASEEPCKLYAEGYSLRRLRDRSVKRGAHDRFHDGWEALKIVFRGLVKGEPRLGLPALAGLFAEDQCPTLEPSRLENRFLLQAVFRLSWLREPSGLSRVNWRDMGPEELGSVYESLLELVPQIAEGGRAFSFATGAETKGHARKTTGSYYTPDSLVQVLLNSALEPVIERTVAEHPDDPVAALLSLSVVDPACGSGHFLLAAARRLAAHVARIQTGGTPSAPEYRRALRSVVGRCIYGVDLNPMAVELCKVSLWMEAVEPGLPLTFLRSHIRHGNALIGATPELMEKGIPDDAWNPIQGDDRKVATALKKRNKQAPQGQRSLESLWSQPSTSRDEELRRAVAALDAASDASVEQLATKQASWAELLSSAVYQREKLVADAWCAAFVWPKQAGPLADAAPTNDLWLQIRDGQGQPPDLTVKTATELAEQYSFFHWHLAFPQVFARDGFDVVLGNPPWERVKLQEKEWFAARNTDIAAAPKASIRKALIASLRSSDPDLYSQFCQDLRKAEGESHFLRSSVRFPLCGRGDINLYATFAETMRAILGSKGYVGGVLPTGIATDDTTKFFFQDVVRTRSLVALFDFENRKGLFPTVDSRMKFCLLVLASGRPEGTRDAEFVFFAHGVEDLRDPERSFGLSLDDIALLNPNSLTCPIFRSRRDAELTTAIYRRIPVLRREDVEDEAWGISFCRMFDMSNDSHKFRSRSDLESDGWRLEGNSFHRDGEVWLPLYEGKMFFHFTHRWANVDDIEVGDLANPTTTVFPRYWVPKSEVESIASDVLRLGYTVAYRWISNSTNERTFVAAPLPCVGAGNSAPIAIFRRTDPTLPALWSCIASSFVFDYVTRQKLGGTNVTYGTIYQLPWYHPAHFEQTAPWLAPQSLRDWFFSRILELTYTSWDMNSVARSCGHDLPPSRWDEARRFIIRCELDAAMFHLYLPTASGGGWLRAERESVADWERLRSVFSSPRDAVVHIMDTFVILSRKEAAAVGEFRTKKRILDIYDEMAEATRTGNPYQTRLDPPPADPRVAHPANTRPDWGKRNAS